MHLIANSIQPNDVREETRNGDQYYVVEDVPFVKPMRLAGGYVPEDSIKDATPDWDQTPVDGEPPTEQTPETRGTGATSRTTHLSR